jgi:hypothetical protein
LAELAAPKEEESAEASEGTLTHELGAQLINDACRGLLPEKWGDVPNLLDPIYTPDQIRAAHGYAWDVFKVLRTFRILGGPHMGIETRVDIKSIHDAMFGTTDMWVYSAEYDELLIWDLKYGFLVVEPIENWQMISYASGLIDALELTNPDTKVQFRIYQPRAPHPQGVRRMWKTTVGELEDYILKLRDAAWWALSDRPQTVPGAHCRYCRARYACTALQRSALEAASYIGTPMPSKLAGQGLAVELAILEYAKSQLEYRLTAIQEQAAHTLRAGGSVPGYRMTAGRGSVRWKLPEATVAALAAGAGVDVRKGMMTPKQAREAGVPDEIVDACSEHRSGKMSVKPVDMSAAQMVFGGNNNG